MVASLWREADYFGRSVGFVSAFSESEIDYRWQEHDPSFKQQDPAPRYNARDAAIFLASQYKAKVLLGTATPSVETYANAQNGKFALVEMTERFGGLQMPEIAIVDMKEETKKKGDRENPKW